MSHPILTYIFTDIVDTDPDPDPDDLSGDYLEIKVCFDNVVSALMFNRPKHVDSDTAIATAASIGATTLVLADADDYTKGRVILVGGTQYTITAADYDAETVDITPSLVAAAAVSDPVTSTNDTLKVEIDLELAERGYEWA